MSSGFFLGGVGRVEVAGLLGRWCSGVALVDTTGRSHPPGGGGRLVVSHTVAGPAMWVAGVGRSFVAQPLRV